VVVVAGHPRLLRCWLGGQLGRDSAAPDRRLPIATYVLSAARIAVSPELVAAANPICWPCGIRLGLALTVPLDPWVYQLVSSGRPLPLAAQLPAPWPGDHLDAGDRPLASTCLRRWCPSSKVQEVDDPKKYPNHTICDA
jgi:hypothetical protein